MGVCVDARIRRLGCHDHAGGLTPVDRFEPTAGLVDVGIDSMTGDAELAADLFRTLVLGHEAQDFPLARGEARNRVLKGVVRLVHA